MNYFFIGAIVVLFLLVFLMIYMYKKTYVIKDLKKIKNKYYRTITRILLILLPYILFGFVNGVVIVFHTAIFLGISDIINHFIKSKKKRHIVSYVAVGVTIAYLIMGFFLNQHVFETVYNIETDKNIGVDNFKIVQISDAHAGTSFDGKKFKKIVSNINSKVDSDIVVITGDLVDDNTSYEDMALTCEALSLLTPKYGTYFVYGNHDKGYYGRNFTAKDLEKELLKNNVKILEDEIVYITSNIVLIGRKDRQDSTRLDIEELTNGIDKSKYIIDLNHQPNDYDNESKANIDLVLSGHSHGGQIFPLGPISKLIKANNEYDGLHKRGNTSFIVNSGISGWEVRFKTGTKSEYAVINIRGNNE